MAISYNIPISTSNYPGDILPHHLKNLCNHFADAGYLEPLYIRYIRARYLEIREARMKRLWMLEEEQ
jgi:hypothetical protein